MTVLLIQPPGPGDAVEPRDAAFGHSTRFTPDWSLLCLRSYLMQRTRYTCHYVDTRFFGNLEKGIEQQLSAHPGLRLALVYATSTGIAQTAAVADLLKRHAPQLPVAICGPHPSRFSEHARLPHVDFALCGDPEPILRSLLDHMDAEPRLRRIPGLLTRSVARVDPAWLEDLKSLTLPDFDGVSWPGYRLPPPRQGALAEVSLSRGHSREAFDQAAGGLNEPLRIWPLDRVVSCLQRARHAGVVEAFLTESPGFWRNDRLTAWLDALERERNTLPWSCQFALMRLSPETVRRLALNACRRIEWVCTKEDREKPDCLASLRETLPRLQQAGIESEIRFWVGGPQRTSNEERVIYQTLKSLRFPPHALHAYPLQFDSPAYRANPEPHPRLESWMAHAADPWATAKPVAAWFGEAGANETRQTMNRVANAVLRSPSRRWQRLMAALRALRPIESMESAALRGLSRRTR